MYWIVFPGHPDPEVWSVHIIPSDGWSGPELHIRYYIVRIEYRISKSHPGITYRNYIRSKWCNFDASKLHPLDRISNLHIRSDLSAHGSNCGSVRSRRLEILRKWTANWIIGNLGKTFSWISWWNYIFDPFDRTDRMPGIEITYSINSIQRSNYRIDRNYIFDQLDRNESNSGIEITYSISSINLLNYWIQ